MTDHIETAEEICERIREKTIREYKSVDPENPDPSPDLIRAGQLGVLMVRYEFLRQKLMQIKAAAE